MRNPDGRIPEWLSTLSLYDKVKMSQQEAVDAIFGIDEFSGTFDQFCPECKDNSTFTAQVSQDSRARTLAAVLSYGQAKEDIKDLLKYSICARNPQHMATSYFLLKQDGIVKVGQYPSQADVARGTLQQYNGVLSQTDLSDLGRAIGLYAHGVGAGAFVYLRRIFESLVEEAHAKAKSEHIDWDDAAYKKMRMGERIKALSGYLPELLVEHHNIYGILSDHIHNETEDVCKKNFIPVLEGIYAIADEKLAEKQRLKRAEAFAKAKPQLLAPRNG